jgi:rubrerythrin
MLDSGGAVARAASAAGRVPTLVPERCSHYLYRRPGWSARCIAPSPNEEASMLEGITPRKVVEFAVTTEEIGAKFYRRMARRFSDDPEVAEVFAQLARDEEAHQRQFTKLLDEVPPTFDDQVEYERAQYLRAMAISEFFSKTGPFRDSADVAGAAEALKHALDFEKAALGYYRAIREELGEQAGLDGIIAAEKQHVARLMKVITTGARFRSLEDNWA